MLEVGAAYGVPAQGAAPPLSPGQGAARLLLGAGEGGGGALLVHAPPPGPGHAPDIAGFVSGVGGHTQPGQQ